MDKVPQYNITIHSGTDYQMDIQFILDDDDQVVDYTVIVVNGILIDGSGCTVTEHVWNCTEKWVARENTLYYTSEYGRLDSQLREFPEARDFFDFDVTVDIDGYHLKLSHEVTEKIPFTYGVYDVFLTDSTGHRTKILQGEAKIIVGGTRWQD